MFGTVRDRERSVRARVKRRRNSAPIATVGDHDIVQRGVRQALIEAVLVVKALPRPSLAGVRLIVARVATLTLVVEVLTEVRIAVVALTMVRTSVASNAVPEALSWRRHLPRIDRKLLVGLGLLRCVLKSLLLRGLLTLRYLLTSGNLDRQSRAAIDQRARGELARDRSDWRTDPGSGLIRRLSGEKRGISCGRRSLDTPDAARNLRRRLSGHRLSSSERIEDVIRPRCAGEELVLSGGRAGRQQSQAGKNAEAIDNGKHD